MVDDADMQRGLEVLDHAECVHLLATRHLGRVGIVDHGRPLVLPVNYALDGDNIVFRTNENTPIHRAAGRAVAFEIDGADNLYHAGWSVLLTGNAEVVRDHAALARLPIGPWGPGAKAVWMRIRPQTVSGRRIGASRR